MPDVVLSLNKIRDLPNFRRITRWEAATLPSLSIGDFLFLAWDGAIRAFAPIRWVWFEDELPDAPWVRRNRRIRAAQSRRIHINYVEAGPFVRLREQIPYIGRMGYRYVRERLSDRADAIIIKAKDAYKESAIGKKTFERIHQRARQRAASGLSSAGLPPLNEMLWTSRERTANFRKRTKRWK